MARSHVTVLVVEVSYDLVALAGMDVSESSSPIYSQPGSPSSASLSEPSSSKPSGLKLILPPLRGGKPVKAGKKSKPRYGSQPTFGGQDEEKKIIRPVKLKPLKEVLAKLIVQIQRYAFLVDREIVLTIYAGRTTMLFSSNQ